MSEYVNLPWIPSADQFLQAMIAGGQVGLQRQKMQLDANQFNALNNRPTAPVERSGGGGGGYSRPQITLPAPTGDPHILRSGTIITPNAPGYVGYVDPNKNANAAPTAVPYEAINFGGGGVGKFNRLTGQWDIVSQPTPQKKATAFSEWEPAKKDADGRYFQVNKKTGEKRYVTEPITQEQKPTSEIPDVSQPGGGFWNGVNSALNPFASEPGAVSTQTPTWNSGMPWQSGDNQPQSSPQSSGTLRAVYDERGNLVLQ